MVSEAQKRASAKYDKSNAYHVGLKFNRKTDKDVVEKLENCKNKCAYIRKLVKADIRRNGM